MMRPSRLTRSSCHNRLLHHLLSVSCNDAAWYIRTQHHGISQLNIAVGRQFQAQLFNDRVRATTCRRLVHQHAHRGL
jgi:hypothetical protein